MAINVFEGARRIAKLIAAMWVIGCVVAAFNVSSSVDVTYQVAGPAEAPIRMAEECPSDSATEHIYSKVTRGGTKATVELCFLAATGDNGDRLIPFRTDSTTKQWWGGKKYSSAVNEYTERVKASFTIPHADEEWIDRQRWLALLKAIGHVALIAIGGLVFLFAFTWAAGWIVRGFMGIPRGSDSRE